MKFQVNISRMVILVLSICLFMFYITEQIHVSHYLNKYASVHD